MSLPSSIAHNSARKFPTQMFRYSAARRFQLILIKPSHYDDDGYVIRWWRAMSPATMGF